MSIGYACKLIGVKNVDMRSCILKNATKDTLLEIIKHNINSLNNIMDYNVKNNIKLFRISSDLIPFGSSDVNDIKWWELYSSELSLIGEKIKNNNMRVSVHPGQYTVLNSNNDEVVERAVKDLVYHTRILDSLNATQENKLVLHIGGAYDNKKLSIKRFEKNYKLLDEKIKKRLVIENDDKIYNIEEVLNIGERLNIPVIFDNLHHELNCPETIESEKAWIEKCKLTWKKQDGNQKIHYSQQAQQKKKGSHSDYISINEFMKFYEMLDREDIDIMLEVKDKNLSCIKCINCTNRNISINNLEQEWSKYKYTMLEKSQKHYLEVRELLKEKQNFSVVKFYNLLENGLDEIEDIGNNVNALLHVWGYFKNDATEKEKSNFFKYLENFKDGRLKLSSVKNHLKKLAEKYDKDYLLNSYYFDI